MSWNFVRFHKVLFKTDAESFSFLSCQYQNKKALFTDPIFSEGFENRENERGCFNRFTTYCASSRFPIFSTYWFIVIGTGITQFALHWWVWPVFLGSWPFGGPIPPTDFNDKSAERFCEKTPYQVAFGFLVLDMIIGFFYVILGWFWKLFWWCGWCCCCSRKSNVQTVPFVRLSDLNDEFA